MAGHCRLTVRGIGGGQLMGREVRGRQRGGQWHEAGAVKDPKAGLQVRPRISCLSRNRSRSTEMRWTAPSLGEIVGLNSARKSTRHGVLAVLRQLFVKSRHR